MGQTSGTLSFLFLSDQHTPTVGSQQNCCMQSAVAEGGGSIWDIGGWNCCLGHCWVNARACRINIRWKSSGFCKGWTGCGIGAIIWGTHLTTGWVKSGPGSAVGSSGTVGSTGLSGTCSNGTCSRTRGWPLISTGLLPTVCTCTACPVPPVPPSLFATDQSSGPTETSHLCVVPVSELP